MKAYQLALSVAAIAVIMTGCGEGGGSSSAEPVVQEAVQQNDLVALQSGRFIDSAVSGLQYSCNPSGRTGVTNSSGIFTCNSGDLISFYIAQNFIGSAILQDIVTPKTFYPNNEEAMINLAQLLQTLDEDSNPDNGIVIDNEKAARLLNQDLDFEDRNFDDDVEGYLLESLVNGEAAHQHLENTLIVLNGGSVEDSGLEEPALAEDAIAEVDEGVDTPEPEAEEDSLPEDLGIETPEESDEGSSSSSPWQPDLGFDRDDLIPDEGLFEHPELDLGALGSSSSESSGSSSSVGIFIPDYSIPEIAPVEIGSGTFTPVIPNFYMPSNFKSTYTLLAYPSQEEMQDACSDEFGENATIADWNQIKNMASRGIDLDQVVASLELSTYPEMFILEDGESHTPEFSLDDLPELQVPFTRSVVNSNKILKHGIVSSVGDYYYPLAVVTVNELANEPTLLAPVACYVPTSH